MRLLFALSLLFLIQSARAQVDKVRFDVPKEISVGQTFELGIHFSLTALAGMARLQLDFPKGFEVQEGKNSGALFTFSSNLLQLLWVQLPQSDSMHCTVKVRCLPGYGGKAEIPCRFYYLENGVRKEIALNSCKLNITGEAGRRFMPVKREESKPIAPAAPKTGGQASPESGKTKAVQADESKNKGNSEKATTPQKVSESSPNVDNSSKANSEKTEMQVNSPNAKGADKENPKEVQTEKSDKTKSSSSNGITFRIQLAASSEKSSPETLALRFNVKPTEIVEEFHNGMYKYTTGNFNNLAGARDAMGKNQAMKTGCFIAGYENGTRIALEDAIRLSKK